MYAMNNLQIIRLGFKSAYLDVLLNVSLSFLD